MFACLILNRYNLKEKPNLLYPISSIVYQSPPMNETNSKLRPSIKKKRIFDILMPFVSCHREGEKVHNNTRRKYIARNTVALYASVISHSYSGTLSLMKGTRTHLPTLPRTQRDD